MFDWLVDTFTQNPYLGVGVVFVLCGLGLPLPEEVVLVTAGYVSFKGFADPVWMGATCAGAILFGDVVPFLLGRLFGPRLLRLRPLRMIVNRRRLAKFDVWFRRRGDLVVFFARFVPGLRVVAFFTAGTMRMRPWRFLLLDGAGVLIVCPPLVWIGYRFGATIDEAVRRVQEVERGLLWGVLASGLAFLAVRWLRRRRRARELARVPTDTYVSPRVRRPAEAKTEGEAPAPGPTSSDPDPAPRNDAPPTA